MRQLLRLLLLLSLVLSVWGYEIPIGEGEGQILDPSAASSLYFPPPVQEVAGELVLLDMPTQTLRFYTQTGAMRQSLSLTSTQNVTWGPFHDFVMVNPMNYYLTSWTNHSLVKVNHGMGIYQLLALSDSPKAIFRSVGEMVLRDRFLFINDLEDQSVRIFAQNGSYLGLISAGGQHFFPLMPDEVLALSERGSLSVLEKVRLDGTRQPFYEYRKGEKNLGNSLTFCGYDGSGHLYVEKVFASELGIRQAELLRFTLDGQLTGRIVLPLNEKEYFEFENYFVILKSGPRQVRLRNNTTGQPVLAFDPVSLRNL